MNPLCRPILPAGRPCTQPAVRATLYRRLRLSLLGRHSWQSEGPAVPEISHASEPTKGPSVLSVSPVVKGFSPWKPA
jgi:hypothetical protein